MPGTISGFTVEGLPSPIVNTVNMIYRFANAVKVYRERTARVTFFIFHTTSVFHPIYTENHIVTPSHGGVHWSGFNQQSGYILELNILMILYFHFCTLCTARFSVSTIPSTVRTIAYTVVTCTYTESTVNDLYGAAPRFAGCGAQSGSIVPSCFNTYLQLQHIMVKTHLERSVNAMLRVNNHIALTTNNWFAWENSESLKSKGLFQSSFLLTTYAYSPGLAQSKIWLLAKLLRPSCINRCIRLSSYQTEGDAAVLSTARSLYYVADE